MIQAQIDTLTKLKERIQEQGTIMGSYVEEGKDGRCQFCAVGHLLEIQGTDIDRVRESYNATDSDDLPEDILINLEQSGLSSEEIFDMQIINDRYASEEVRKEKLILFIDGKINRIKDYDMTEVEQ